MSTPRLVPALLAILGLLAVAPAFAMGTAFTYQGTLEDAGLPANGSYDFQFRLISSNGADLGSNLHEDVAVNGGVFTVVLDFGSADLFPGTFVRFLEIGIRPGASTGDYQILSPLSQIHPAPHALRAAEVVDFSVTSASLAAAAVSSTKLADGAVSSTKLADSAVTETKLANSAVTNAKIANGSLTTSRMAGALNNYTIGGATVAAHSCNDYNVTFGGDVVAGDFPIIAMQPGGSLPANMSVTALRVPADNQVQVRICNVGSTSASLPASLGIKLMTHR